MKKVHIHENRQVGSAPAQQTVEQQRLKAALVKVAMLVDENTIYMPIFQRIELELEAFDVKCNAVSRARTIAAQHQMVLA